MWRTGGTFELDGRRYEIRANRWGSTYKMVAEDGATVASVDSVGRKVDGRGRWPGFRVPAGLDVAARGGPAVRGAPARLHQSEPACHRDIDLVLSNSWTSG